MPMPELVDENRNVCENEEEEIGEDEKSGPRLVYNGRINPSLKPDKERRSTNVPKSHLVAGYGFHQEVDHGDETAAGGHPSHHPVLPHRHHPLETDQQPQLHQPANRGQTDEAHQHRPDNVVKDDQSRVWDRPDQNSPNGEQVDDGDVESHQSRNRKMKFC